MISCNELTEEYLNLTSNSYTKIPLCQYMEIVYTENKASVIYRFQNITFEENDSISLDFIQYKTSDSIHFTSGCLDGTMNQKFTKIKEFNSDFIPIEQLPEKIHVKLNQSELIFVKEVIQEIQFSTGKGLKEEKKWGFIESTFTRSVIYSATNANQLEIEK